MGNTITVRVPEHLAEWLAETSRKTGLPVGKIIREQLEKVRQESREPRFLRHAGKISGPRNLSSRKGFSTR